MALTSCSIDLVLGRVVRNTKLQDTSVLNDAVEWIPEAMGYMKTKFTLSPRHEDVPIHFHRGRMPCGIHTLKAVEWRGGRLHWYNGDISPSSLPSNTVNGVSVYPGIPKEGDTIFYTQLVKREALNEGMPTEYYETLLHKACELPFHDGLWYNTELDYINTNLQDTVIRLHFWAMPMDSKGLPLIPDNENYKEALFYYVLAKMIAQGFQHKVFNEEICMLRFEKHAEKAVNEIRYPTPDRMETMMGTLNRLVFPEDYLDNFSQPYSDQL